MEILRTPDDRFVGLPDYDFAPHFANVPAGDDGPTKTVRMHFVDQGPDEGVEASGETVLCLHGEPSWSYLYRHMIPVLTAAGHRVIAPDLVGFGRSDKPKERTDYTYQRHMDWLTSLVVDHLDLQGVTLMCQDWGGLLGLRLVAEHPERFARLVAANTFLPTGDHHPGEGFLNWQRFSQDVEDFDIGFIINMGSSGDLTPEVMAAYNAPFPGDEYKSGARQFPMLVPTSPDDPAAPANRAAWQVLEAFDKPFLCAFSDKDPVTGGGDRVLKERIPGAKGQSHTTIEGGGHFLQEDCGPALARAINDFVTATRT